MLFILIDTIPKEFSQKYPTQLKEIHQILLNKLIAHDVLVIGGEESAVAQHKFKNAKTAYQFLAKQNQDLLLIDAYAAFLSLQESEAIYQYTQKGQYDICLIENLPLGIVPAVINKDFAKDLPEFIEDETPLSSELNLLVNWEYQGIDVGVYLSHNKTILRRIDFLPTNKSAINYILNLAEKSDLTLDNIDQFIDNNQQLLRNAPAFIALELSPKNDHFYARDFSKNTDMTLHLFQKIQSELKALAPEAILSLGVWGEPLVNKDFEAIFDSLADQRVFVETKMMNLDRNLFTKVLSRPNTELIIDVTFTTDSSFAEHKNHPHSLSEIKNFINSLPYKEQIWIRLVRAPESETHIKNFLQEWQDFNPRIIITKTDSVLGGQVVDLSPITRHACLALRRELTILSDGTVLICRQSNIEESLGSLVDQNLETLWNKNHQSFLDQEQGKFSSCSFCQKCDDWWVWN
ncbi:MAG: SPASM domain-containing protein [Brevinema sp.]